MKKAFAALLAVIGIPLELYFYWFRFVNEGMAGWVAIVVAVGLTVLLSTFVYFVKADERRIWLWAAAIVALFDIFSTSAGQSFAMAQVETTGAGAQAVLANAEWSITDSDAQIVRLDREYDQLVKQEESLGSVADRAKWKTAVDSIAKAKLVNRDLRQAEQERKSSASSGLGTAAKDVKINVYAYYESLFGLPARWIQFILHTMLSVCIVAMAPVAVLLWPTEVHSKAEKVSTTTERAYETPVLRQMTTSPVATRMMRKKDKTEGEVARELEALERITTAVEALNDPADPREIGRALEMSHTPVYSAVKSGELAAVSMNPVRVSKDEVMRWVESRLNRESSKEVEQEEESA
jgi:hypothetical protein